MYQLNLFFRSISPIFFDVLVLLASLVLLARSEWWPDKRTKKYKRITRLLYFLIVVSTFSSLYQNYQTRSNEEAFQKQVLMTISDRVLRNEELKELIALKYKDVFASTESDAKAWARNFVDKLEDKRASMESLDEKSKILEGQYLLKWQPLYKYVMDLFDERINALKARGVGIKVDRREQPLIVVDNGSTKSQFLLREIVFADGGRIGVNIQPGYIQSGTFVSEPRIIFQESQRVFDLSFSERSCEIYPINPRYVSIGTESSAPLEDQEFKTGLMRAIEMLISNSILAYRN